MNPGLACCDHVLWTRAQNQLVSSWSLVELVRSEGIGSPDVPFVLATDVQRFSRVTSLCLLHFVLLFL